MREPTDAELWRSVATTVERVLVPAIADDWARVAAVQLVGMARYGATRPPDPTAARTAELADALDRLRSNEIVGTHWPDRSETTETVFGAVSRVLADAVGRDDAAGDEVRAALRPVVVRHLDDDLAVTGPMMAYFRGRLPDA